MRSNFLKKIGVSAAALAGIAVAVSIIPFRAQGDEWDKMTLLTLDEPTQVYDTYLAPGTYMFKLASDQSDREIVQIFNKDETQIYATVLAIPNYRLKATDKTVMTFRERPAGE